MPQTVKTIPVKLGDLRAASTADGGAAIDTTVVSSGGASITALGITTIPFGSDYISITPRNFSTAAVAKYSLNPFLTIFWTDSSGNNINDITDEMQDGDATDSAIDDLPTLANGGAMYVGALEQFRGVAVDVGADPNATSSDLTVKYWRSGGSWEDISDTDDTDSGASFARDGTVTWSIPSDWSRQSLNKIGAQLGSGFEFDFPSDVPENGSLMYWTRWEWTAAMDSSTDIVQMLSLNRSTAAAEYIEGQTVELSLGRREIGNIQGSTNAGTANLLINVGVLVGNRFE